MPNLFLTIFTGLVKKVEDNKITVEIPDLGVTIPIYDVWALGYSESQSGYISQLPKEEDTVMVTFLGAKYHNPILILGQKTTVEKIKRDQEFIRTQRLEILPEKGKTDTKVVIDNEGKKISVSGPSFECSIDMNSGSMKVSKLSSCTIEGPAQTPQALLTERFFNLFVSHCHSGGTGPLGMTGSVQFPHNRLYPGMKTLILKSS